MIMLIGKALVLDLLSVHLVRNNKAGDTLILYHASMGRQTTKAPKGYDLPNGCVTLLYQHMCTLVCHRHIICVDSGCA
jgi:hypothetical protein